MKKITKLLSLALAILMVMSLAGAAFATGPQTTITITKTSAGAEYTFYRLLDLSQSADGKNYSYTPNATYRNILIEVLTLSNADGSAVTDDQIIAAISSKRDDAAAMKSFAVALHEKIKNLGNAGTATVAENANSVTYTGDYGYYLISQTKVASGANAATSAIMIDTGAKNGVSIEAKTSVPSSSKNVTEVDDSQNSSHQYRDGADHDIGDTIEFVMQATLADNIDDFKTEDGYQLIFHDLPSNGLTFNKAKANFKIVLSHQDSVTYPDAPITKYTVVEPGEAGYSCTRGCPFHVKLNLKDIAPDGNTSLNYVPHPGDIIRVWFNMTLNDNALAGSPGNPNRSWIQYSNNSLDSTQTGYTPDDKVTVFTFDLEVDKVDGNNVPLEGAEFKLYKKIQKSADPTDYELKEISLQENGVKVVDGESKTTKVRFTWHGIDSGMYKLEETKVPTGYTKAKDIYFQVVATYDPLSQDPKLTGLKVDMLGSSFGPNPGVVNSFTAVGDGDAQYKTLVASIENESGTVLPNTGGIGTTLFYVFGSVLAIGAGVLLISKKRMGAVD